jgi:hypothetical protein
MATVPVLDVNQPIVQIIEQMSAEIERNGAPSPYFEELWYTLTVCLTEFDARITALEGP